MLTKLTLSADRDVVARAKRHAKAHHTSVSSLVSRLLDGVTVDATRGPNQPDLAPATRAASGLISPPPHRADRKLLEDALADAHGK